ncbi:hypothetical protein FJT64_025554 [Amphibalanus amphitrite]|uniref:SH3 domain-containing protein n=1 Tax=Amphibalanus amphitrite TaxID=1232801 RepID=A0A6A4WJJ5_AMPAM|nr:hypothetical protein FJT64_025554 [Amphibalanus amphitrite]
MFVRPSTGFCRTQLELIDSRGPTALLGKELTWVVSDYSAQAAGELTVSRGQQVELLDAGAPGSDLCQIRLPQTEMTGLVPAAVLQARPRSQELHPSVNPRRCFPVRSECGFIVSFPARLLVQF